MDDQAETPQGGRCVLVVDDSTTVRYTVASLLREMGFRVVEAADGTEVFSLVEAQRPVLVILDVHMPEKGGVAALTELRADPRFRGLPVIVLTASADQATVRKVARLKANGYLLKENLTAGQMRERICAVLGKDAVPPSAGETGPAAGAQAAAASGVGGGMVNRTEVLERVGNDVELLKHLVELFLRETPGLVEATRQAIAQRDRKELQRAAHTLKGVLGNLSAHTVAAVAGRLEAAAQGQPLAEAAAALAELEQAMSPLEEELRRMLSS